MIDFIHYDEVAAELHVLFASGKAYVYYGVPRKAYDAFLHAPSIGAFFNAEIRTQYRYRCSIATPGRNSAVSSPGSMR